MQLSITNFKTVICETLIILLALLMSIGFVPPAIASDIADFDQPNILILKSSDAELYSKIASELTFALALKCQSCPEKKPIIDTRTVADINKEIINNLNYNFIITLGKQAWLEIEDLDLKPEIKKLHTVLPLDQDILKAKSNQYFLVLEQSYKTQLDILTRLFESKPNLTVLYSANSEWRKELLETASQKLNIHLRYKKFDSTNRSSISQILKDQALSKSSILMLPDKEIYNRSNINQIFISGYANNITFIGYSISLVKTGAVISLVTPKTKIAGEISRLAYEMLENKKNAGVYYPSSYKVLINENILKALNMEIDQSMINKINLEVVQ